jgi:hypothetical protein
MTAQDRDLLMDFQVGSDAVRKQYGSTWWSWDAGSTFNFWRWPEGEQRTAARDGSMPAYISGTLPHYFRGAKKPNPESYDLLVKKLRKMFDRGYVAPLLHGELVESLVDYFSVPKADDIRPVYNGTNSGLNAAVWAPNFWLPTTQSETDVLNYGYLSVHLDLGEMFHNFPLPHVFRPYSGLDLTPFRADLEPEPRLGSYFRACWEKCWMGFRPSPYYGVRFYYWAKEFARGNRKDANNPLCWDPVKLNLPGVLKWNPALPRVMKWNDAIANIAGDLKAFVDDLRCSGVSEEHAWQIGRRVAAIFQYLGIQDAPRKRKPPVLVTAAWAGSTFSTALGKIEKFVSQKKWDKARK